MIGIVTKLNSNRFEIVCISGEIYDEEGSFK